MHVSVVHERQIVLAQAARCIRVYCTTHWSSPHTHCMHCIDDCTHILYETVQADLRYQQWTRVVSGLAMRPPSASLVNFDD